MTTTIYTGDAVGFYDKDTFIDYMNQQECLEKVNRPAEIKRDEITVTNWFYKESGECLRYIHTDKELTEPRARVTVYTNREEKDSPLVKLVNEGNEKHIE